MLIEYVGGGVCVAAGLMAYGVRSRSSSLFGPSVWHGSAGRPAIALTFDDGPSESTPRLLDLLDEQGVRATFFECGMHVRRLPEVTRAVAAAGHEIGNHGDSHTPLYFRSTGGIYGELCRAQEAISEACGVSPVLFRAPYGARWPGLRAAQRRLGLLGVMWTAIGKDWKLPAAAVAKRLVGAARSGAIFCLHDGRAARLKPEISASIEAVRRLIPALREKGYHFETVSEILCPTN
jgi:peptidoglycan/xylan/chitin deacetylase (PgdA/CDA1 family)